MAQVKKNPLKRALRLDKMTLVALAEILKLYRDPAQLTRKLPTLRLLTRDMGEIRALAESLQPDIAAHLSPRFEVTVEDCLSQIGSGSLPVDTLPSAAIRLQPASGDDAEIREMAKALRELPIPVIGRIHKGAIWLDLRCLEVEQTEAFSAQLTDLTR